MALDLPDFWTTAGLGLALLSLVPGMTSVPSASHIEFKVSRLCALAAATLFLIKLALWGAEDLTITRLVLVALFGALIAVSAAFALHWINRKEEATSAPERNPITQDARSSTPMTAAGAKPMEAATVQRGPTLEATNNSTISARGATIPGDLPFQVGRADNNSLIELSGSNFSKNPDGSITFTPGRSPEFQFPAPTGEFAELSVLELHKKLASATSDLKGIQKLLDQDYGIAKTEADFQDVFEKHRPTLEKYADLSFSLASAAMAKIGKISAVPGDVGHGGMLVYHRKLIGPKSAQEASSFLDFLATKLPRAH